jgi:hypothetical protein
LVARVMRSVFEKENPNDVEAEKASAGGYGR